MKRIMLAAATLMAAIYVSAATPVTGKVNSISQSEFATYVSDYKGGIKAWKFKGSRPAVIDFYATWCGPCKKLAPIMDELAKEYSGKIDFYKVDIDQAPQIAQAYGVSSIPMVLFVPAKGDPQGIMGFYPKEEIVKAINYVIYNKK